MTQHATTVHSAMAPIVYNIRLPPMPAFINLIGQRFGRLVVLARDYTSRSHRIYWRCQCDCGTVRTFAGQELRRGQAKSCNCLRIEQLVARMRSHGEAARATYKRTPEYRAWQEMRRRCSAEHRRGYDNYGGRGIRVCAEWDASFETFLAHVGRRPSPHHSLDRINNDGHYEPGNVRWATPREQRANQRPHRHAS
jgi:hypothetical protein